MNLTWLIVFVVLSGAVIPSSIAGELVVLEKPVFAEHSWFDVVKDISASGQTIVGSLTGSDGLPKPVLWSWENERYSISDLDLVGAKGVALAIGSSSYALANMSTVGSKPQMVYWSRQKNRQVQRLIAGPGQANIAAMSRHQESPRLVGSTDGQAFFWTEQEGLGILPIKEQQVIISSEALAIDTDGQFIAGSIIGSGFQQVVLWQWIDQQFEVRTLPYFDKRLPFAKASGISDRGQQVVGAVMTERGLRAAVWSGDSRPMVLPAPQNTQAAFATAVSADGLRIIGQVKFEDGQGQLRDRSFLWQEDLGLRLIEDLLATEDRKQVQSWTAVQAEVLSADGNTIVGEARNAENQKILWSVRL